MSSFLETAIAAAKAAEAIIQKYYVTQFDVQIKADQSPVTIADIEAEKIIKRIIQQSFPEHGFYGEETGQEGFDKEYIWLVDPIDGTKSFVRHYPFFSTQIALWHQGELIVGVSNAPLFHELAYAEKGQGAYLNHHPVKVNDISSLQLASLSMGNIKTLSKTNSWQNLATIMPEVQRTRGYGDFYHYHLLASGKVDIIIESDVNILDIAALKVIIEEAGGCFTDLKSAPIDFNTTTVLATSTPALHKQVSEILAY